MAIIQLSEEERSQLKEVVRRTHSARQLRRAQALLELDDEGDVATVAQRQGVGRSTVYDWVHRFVERRAEPVAERLEDRGRSGRPAHKRRAAKDLVESVIDTDPGELGYRYTVWMTPLLRHHLKKERGIELSQKTVGRALRELDYRHKRPRHALARRSQHWRQAKGGLNADLRGASAR
jgi:transposase